MQAPEIMPEIIKLLASPASSIAVIYFYDRFIARKRNGPPTKEVLHHLDMALTGHFDQLRRDLSITIEHTMEQGGKSMENAITKLLLQSELRWRDKR